MAAIDLPKLPVAHDGLVNYVANHPETPMREIMEPFRKYEAKLREVYAQERNNPALDNPYLNTLPLFTKDTPSIKTRARNLEAESPEEKEKYIMTLPDDRRRPNGSPAVVTSLKEFRRNFGIFSESSLAEMDWSNVVAAGSSVVNCLLPVPDRYNSSKRALREYYHQKFCPASDVDLFLYGLDEQQAIEKIKDIEARVRDAILSEVTVVRTKNAITICSQYPTRHIQIVLRVYRSISEILTGFDIDCSCAAYDGEQVYCTPRALASYITQINPIDLSRRSPSYENRLSKYSHRNFEVYWSELDRSRVDPTIFERSFQRVLGLARLLVLERLPTTNARDEYMKKRRQERGRPELPFRYQRRLRGNIKDYHEDEVADWVAEDEVANYHTFTIPYGEKFHAKKVEKLCYTKDLLLNAEWNQPKEREVYLHRHPAFFGRVQDVIDDCCGTCPKPKTPEEIEVAEKESEIYVSGKVTFRIDDPGRQQIGSFNPLTEDDWTEMAYVGNTARLCQAIVDGDLEHVEDWLSQEGADPNKRDYTGRTPLHLAVSSSTPQIVKCLVDHGARLVARLADGRTALHLAATRGDIEILKILLERSNANEEEEGDKLDRRRKARNATSQDTPQVETDEKSGHESDENSDTEMISDEESDRSNDIETVYTAGSFVKVDKDEKAEEDEASALEDGQGGPDFYKIDAIAWDSKCSPLHLAILGGHCEVVKLLCQEFGADVFLPVKHGDGSHSNPNVAILTLTLALALPTDKAIPMVETLLSLGATSSQAETNGVTAFHRYARSGRLELMGILLEKDKIGLQNAINHVATYGSIYHGSANNPLVSALDAGSRDIVSKLLQVGAKVAIDFDDWLKSAKVTYGDHMGVRQGAYGYQLDTHKNLEKFLDQTEQPLIVAIRSRHPADAIDILEKGADPNTVTKVSHAVIRSQSSSWNKGQTALDLVRDILQECREYKGQLVKWSQASQSGEEAGFYNSETNTYQKRPAEPFGIEEFLAKFSPGTYQHWAVSLDITATLESHKNQMKWFENEKAKKSNPQDLRDKLDVLEDVISQLESVENILEAKGAKTFKEQYPKAPEQLKRASYHVPVNEPSAYELKFSFNALDATGARNDAYIKLLEAAWAGDLPTIKSLTLAPWDAEKKEPPLKIAVSDAKHNNPFSLAFIRGHYDVAKAILEIAHAQWAPKEEKTKRFTMNKVEGEDSAESESDSDSDDEPGIYEKIIDDKFTIEDVGQVSMQVKSETLATQLLNWSAPSFICRGGAFVGSINPQVPLFTAVKDNDMKAFNFLLDLNIYFASREPVGEDESSRFFTFPQNLFEYALGLGRTEMLATVVKRVGAGIPIDELVKTTGEEPKAKPRYYQGLSVYGKKRADWAKAGRNLVVKTTGSKVPPLLTAAHRGSLESAEWCISDAPMRLYSEFGKSKVAKEDPRLKHLVNAPGGFDRAIAKWLGAQNDLVIHCAVMGQHTEGQNKLVEYLTKVCPASLEARTEEGRTPLYIACLLGRLDLAKTLLDAGADQSVKDNNLNNIIHALLTNLGTGPDKDKLDRLRAFLNLLDPDLRAHMFLQRNNLASGGDTPLHFWLKTANPNTVYRGNRSRFGYTLLNDENSQNVEVLRLLLEFSGGAELGIFNGAGDTVLHSAVLRHLAAHVRVILDQDPDLAYRENAVGRTPGEIAHDLFINSKTGTQKSLETARDTTNSVVSRLKNSGRQGLPATYYRRRGRAPGDAVGKDRKESAWRVLEKHLHHHIAAANKRRRLVSLNEANDVAKRLGESYAGQRYYQRPTSTDAEEYQEQQQQPQQQQDDKLVGFISTMYEGAKQGAWVGRDQRRTSSEPTTIFGSGIYRV
ncbi:ankyrin [Daldinia caldariorum]|uniref:ankyrin n=1 Tax=Daldinia caldariorum TaxID=326644 RepID=UPI002007F7A8|nr:ankyrin [Daldinia caldariorum]KAI1467469.1 ankyrin [Daldinia caldariorum]